MPGPTKAGVRKQLSAMIAAYQPGAQDRTAEAGLAPNYGSMSPLMLRSSMGWGMDPALGAPLPRDPRVFLSGMGPNMPSEPSGVDPRGPGGRALPRLNQYPIAWNLPSAPGTFKMVPFKLMRNMVDMSHVARACIGVRQQYIADVDFEIVPKEEEKGQFKAFPDKKAGLFDQWRSERKALQTFFEHPDPIRNLAYDEWIRMAVEEILVTDSLSVFEHPTWGPGGGVLGSDLFALTILDGTTIKPLLDIRGSIPMPPNPAYQQFIWGLPRVDLTSLVMDSRDDPSIQDAQRGFSYSQAEFLPLTRDQLAYMPFNKRAWTAYGFSNAEQVIMVMNVAMKRLGWHLAAFTEGDIPAMLVHLPETWTLDQVNKFEAQWHAMLAGDQGWKHRMKAVPGAVAAQELKPSTHDMTFDEYIDRMMCAGFAVDPTEIGMSPNSGLGGAGFMQAQADRTKSLTVGPILRRFKRYFDGVILRRFNLPDLEVRYEGLDVDDEETQHKIDIERVIRGTMTVNGYLKKRGEPASTEPNAEKLMFVLGREVVRLEDVGTATLSPDQVKVDSSGKPIAQGLPSAKPDVEPDAAAVKKSIDDEVDSFAQFLKRPRARRFSSEILPKAAIDGVYRRLSAGEERKTVLSDLRKSVLEGSEMLASEVADAILEHVQAEKAGSLR